MADQAGRRAPRGSSEKFLESYEEGHERSAVERYGHYFLGSIIISDKDGQKFIIDGQQRLTTLTLLLIHLHHQLNDDEQKGQIAELIFSQKFGKRSFNLDVPERTACMEALFTGPDLRRHRPAGIGGQHPRALRGYRGLFPEELTGEALPYFVDWLIENVHLVEITAYSDEDAYTIFETMNDRGLSLTPADMLKGYLLANIADADKPRRGEQLEGRIVSFRIGKDEDADGIKSWLRSQHAAEHPRKKAGRQPQDFDLIGTEFHRWVRDHEERSASRERRFRSLHRARLRLLCPVVLAAAQRGRDADAGTRSACTTTPSTTSHSSTRSCSRRCRVEDDESGDPRKIRVMAAYLDILIARRIWNWRAIDYSTMQYAMFLVMRDIRGKASRRARVDLRERLDAENRDVRDQRAFPPSRNERPADSPTARPNDRLRRDSSGMPSRYTEYIQRGRKRL